MVARPISTRPFCRDVDVRRGSGTGDGSEWVVIGGTMQRKALVCSASGSEPISKDDYTETPKSLDPIPRAHGNRQARSACTNVA